MPAECSTPKRGNPRVESSARLRPRRERSVMTGVSKRNLVVVAVAAVVILGGILAVAQFGSSVRAHAVSAREPARCSVATLNGTYVWSAHGEVPVTRGAKRPFAVSGVQVFDARGHAHGFYSQSMDGKISRHVRFTAKYALHGDCTGTGPRTPREMSGSPICTACPPGSTSGSSRPILGLCCQGLPRRGRSSDSSSVIRRLSGSHCLQGGSGCFGAFFLSCSDRY